MPSIRIVTSVYKDHAILNEWINNIDIPITVYVKDDNIKKNESHNVDDRYIHIPNYGRCDYAFLYHIIHNYDKLDDRIIFTKVNWKYTGLDLFRLLNLSKKYDFVESGSYQILQYHKKDRWINDGSPIFFNVHNIFDDPEAYKLYNEMLPNMEPPEIFAGWGHYPCFCVSKELILRHPKSIYEALLKKFHPEETTVSKTALAEYNVCYNKNFNAFNDINTYDGSVLILGIWLHDLFGRLWPLFFTHNIDSLYKIAPRIEIEHIQ